MSHYKSAYMINISRDKTTQSQIQCTNHLTNSNNFPFYCITFVTESKLCIVQYCKLIRPSQSWILKFNLFSLEVLMRVWSLPTLVWTWSRRSPTGSTWPSRPWKIMKVTFGGSVGRLKVFEGVLENHSKCPIMLSSFFY